MNNKKGFTLLEILLVVAMIAILAGIVILAINPSKQMADARNAQRKADINTIMNAIYQYAIDNGGAMPTAIEATPIEICASGGVDCNGYTDLGSLTTNEKYLTAIPRDPSVDPASSHTGYFIYLTGNNRVVITANQAENGATISISR